MDASTDITASGVPQLIQAMDAVLEADADTKSILEQKEPEVAPPTCPYATSIVTVEVGTQSESKQYSVHSGILSRHRELSRGIELGIISISDTDPTIFELVLNFLYTGDYQYYSSSTLPRPEGGLASSLELEMHSFLYCFGGRYKLDGLVSLTMKNIEDFKGIPYRNVLDTARKIYRKLPEDDTWYRDYLKNETRNAMRENVDLTQEPWILDAFKEDNGRITVDLFTTLVSGARQESMVRDLESDTKLTSTISALDNPCEHRKQHLASLKGNGPWKSCPRCRCERDQMMTTGRAIVSVAFADLCPTLNQDINSSPDGISPPKKRKGKKKLRRALREAICHLPIDRITRGILAEDGYEQCPDQAKHLKKVDGKWLWETCIQCQRDRQLMYDKLREVGIGEGFAALLGLGSRGEPNVATIATALPEFNNQNSTVAAEPSERDHILDGWPRLGDPLSPETKTEDVSVDGPEEGWPEVTREEAPIIDEESVGLPPKKKSKNWRKKRIVEAPPEVAPYNFIPEGASDVPKVEPSGFSREASLDTPPDTPAASPSKQSPSAEEPEKIDPWGFWGIPSKKSGKMDKGREACPPSIASPKLECANLSEFN